MRVRWIILFLVALVVLLSSVSFMLWTLGLQYYLVTVKNISSLDPQAKKASSEYFFVADQITYRGSLSFYNKQESIWLWTVKGLKKFTPNKDTIFTLYKTCDYNVHQALIKEGLSITLDDRHVYTNVNQLMSQIKQGDFVEMILDKNKQLAEVRAYDSWWPVIPVISDELCGN